MTFCLAIKVQDGLVALADTRVMTGAERTTARKITVVERPNHAMFIMTAGLRSVRDKAVTYFEETIASEDQRFDKLYKAVNAFADEVRRVASEDREALEDSGLSFNLSALVGGQLERDEEAKLYLLYPQGNWVEVARGTPYFIIGESGYGKPLLDRALEYETPMRDALKVGYLAFDATRRSATDVDFPIDVALYQTDTYRIAEHRYTDRDLKHVSEWWHARLRLAVDDCPSDWVSDSFSKLRGTVVRLERNDAGDTESHGG